MKKNSPREASRRQAASLTAQTAAKRFNTFRVTDLALRGNGEKYR